MPGELRQRAPVGGSRAGASVWARNGSADAFAIMCQLARSVAMPTCCPCAELTYQTERAYDANRPVPSAADAPCVEVVFCDCFFAAADGHSRTPVEPFV